MQRKVMKIFSVDVDATGQLLIINSVFVKNLRKNGNKVKQCISPIDLQKTYDSVRRGVLCNILVEFGIPMKLVWRIKMCLTETYSRVQVGKDLSNMFPIRKSLKQGDVLSSLFFNFVLKYAIRRVQVIHDGLKLNSTHQLLVYANEVNILGGSIHTIKENA
jgi:hypothetical protein